MRKSVVSLAALLLAAPLALTLPAPAAAVGPARLDGSSQAEAELMSLIVTQTNQRRHAGGCPQVTVNHDLVAASESQSGYMAVSRRFGHIGGGGSDFVQRARWAGYGQPAGENIAWGFRTADEVMDAWMASPPHRRNILNCDAKSVGTGVRIADDGTPYFTQVFGWE